MVRVSVLYPHQEGARFDKDYYLNSHMKLVREKLGNALRADTVAFGVSGMAPGSAPAYVCIADLDFESKEAFQKAFLAAGPALGADARNYTDIQAILQVSQLA